MNILAIGDSLTYGFDVPLASGWLARIQQERPTWKVHNFGMCGDSLAGICRRLPHALTRITPDLVFLMGGSNDILVHADHTAMHNDLMPDLITPLQRAISSLSARHIPYLIGAPPLVTQDSMYHGWQTRDGWPIARAWLQTYDSLLHDAFPGRVISFATALTDPRLYDDGVHPNIHGYARMAAVALPYFDACSDAMTLAN